MSDTMKALAGMVALWEATFDAPLRCQCLRLAFAFSVESFNDHPRECAYCIARQELLRGRLAMDEKLVGKT